jgi:hypothetical protein
MAPPKIADYGALLKNLKKELIESTLASIEKSKERPTNLLSDRQPVATSGCVRLERIYCAPRFQVFHRSEPICG